MGMTPIHLYISFIGGPWWRKTFLYWMRWCKTYRGLMCGGEAQHNCLMLLVVKKFNTIRQLYA